MVGCIISEPSRQNNDEGRRSPLKILILESGFGAGGSSKSLLYFLRYIDRDKIEPAVAFYYCNLGIDYQEISETGVYTTTIGMVRPEQEIPDNRRRNFQHYIKIIVRSIRVNYEVFKIALKIYELIKTKQYRMLLFNNDLDYHVSAMIAGIIAGVPCVLRKAGIGVETWKGRCLSPFLDGVMTISEAAGQDYLKHNKMPPEMIIAYPGIEIESLDNNDVSSSIRKQYEISENIILIGMISRLGEGKGHEEVLRAIAQIIPKYEGLVLLIVGDDVDFGGEMLNRLKLIAKELSIDEHVIFAGWRNDVQSILSELDVFIHCPTTWKEGLGIATIEAMAAGVPTIVSNNYGLAETTVDGKTGYVVERGDVDAIAEKILLLLTNDSLRKEMGEAARHRACECFDARKNSRLIGNFLEHVYQITINKT